MRRVAMLLMASVLAPVLASADDATEARFHDGLGREAYARGRYEDALVHFLDAQAAAPSALGAYNVALAADLANERVLAFHFFERYLASAGDEDPTRRAEALRRRDRLAAQLALVRIETEPAGAVIQVDHAELGDWGVTPSTIAVPPGRRRLRLRLEHHRQVEVDVEAAVGALRVVRADLPRHVGTVVVEAEPHDAEVTLTCEGGVVVTTRAGVPVEVPVGSCVARLDAPGHRAVERAITVSADRELRVGLHAPPLPVRRGRLLVRTTEGSARVRVDGVLRGTTPLVLAAEAVGAHRVEVDAEGCLPWRGEVQVREGRATYLNVSLTPAR